MGTICNISGNRYGMLTAVEFVGLDRHRKARWKCRCDCGSETVVEMSSLKSGNTQSCGCLHRKRCAERLSTHGRSKSPEYLSWIAMKARCGNPHHKDWKHYGGRGITVCIRWAESFEQFLADMGTQPAGKNTIERIDTNGNYCKENCRWASQKEQTRNKRNNRVLTHQGVTKTLAEWAEEIGVCQKRLSRRLRLGWSAQEVLDKRKFHRYGKRSRAYSENQTT